ncbi:MAG: hypothetical protein CO118_08605 [Flavobacteriales bacterium CG_4_9_14_3_um_filter_32_8]|nr:MAG: hypothetical protein CO118_08605 [Flavobacteriales bacterium CG_4_9_14_3_um_filter_32_8]
MRKIIGLILLVIICFQNSNAQIDTLVTKIERNKFLPKTIIPATFILTAVVLTNSQSEKNLQKEVRNKVGNDYHNGMDDYIQYAPYAEIYLGDLVGIKAKNHWFDQTKNIAITGILTTLIVLPLKKGIGKERPDGSNFHSFPSGHTATSFAGATILYQEFKDSSPVLAYSGFAFATSTGSLRIMNNKHWVSDVLAGAGIGILVANMVYYFEPLKNWNPVKKNTNISFYPIINGQEVTFVASYKF